MLAPDRDLQSDSNGAVSWRPGKPWSLWDMLTFDGSAIVKAIVTLRNLETVAKDFDQKNKKEGKSKNLVSRLTAKALRKHIREFEDAISSLNTRAAALAVDELYIRLKARKITLTYETFAELVTDVRVTFRRELSLIKTFCIEPKYEIYFDVDLLTFGPKFQTSFSTAVFEIDEAGKCHALGRSTATVFHLMRAMEIGIRAVARSLGIPDPVKDAERNWGKILEKIKKELESRHTNSSWQPGDKDFFAEAYASLDAVRVAWRNPTMHVENKYIEDEAEHIFVTVRGFMKKLSSRLDEQGQPLA